MTICTDPDELNDILAEMKAAMNADPWTYYCFDCDEIFAAEAMREEREPHGEVTLSCPKCGGAELE